LSARIEAPKELDEARQALMASRQRFERAIAEDYEAQADTPSGVAPSVAWPTPSAASPAGKGLTASWSG
jgi:hypothetical protein